MTPEKDKAMYDDTTRFSPGAEATIRLRVDDDGDRWHNDEQVISAATSLGNKAREVCLEAVSIGAVLLATAALCHFGWGPDSWKSISLQEASMGAGGLVALVIGRALHASRKASDAQFKVLVRLAGRPMVGTVRREG